MKMEVKSQKRDRPKPLPLRYHAPNNPLRPDHLMFETHYTEQWTALDLIAERIRALGHRAPASYAEFAKLSSIADDGASIEAGDWKGMVKALVLGNEAVARTARKVFEAASEASDQPTADLLTQRLNVHEKNAWMLRSLLE